VINWEDRKNCDEEDYGDDYDLPNLAAWNEICAAYGNAFWNQKLFLLRQDAKFVDVLERTLYNAFLVGVSLSGDTYLYQAPLITYGNFARQTWFGPNCCPPNLARLLPQLGGLIYARGDQSLYVNLFVGSKAEIRMKQVREVRKPAVGRRVRVPRHRTLGGRHRDQAAPGVDRSPGREGGGARPADPAGQHEQVAELSLVRVAFAHRQPGRDVVLLEQRSDRLALEHPGRDADLGDRNLTAALAGGRQDVRGCDVQLKADRADSDPKVFTKIHFHFVVRGRGLNPSAVERAIQLSHDKYCSATAMLAKTAAITHDYEIVEHS